MAFVEPPQPRASLHDTTEGLEVLVRPRRNLFVTSFLGVWLCFWAAGEVMVPVTVFRGAPRNASVPFLILWLALWTGGGAFALYVFWWSLIGRERIVFSPSRVSIVRELFGMGRSRDYDIQHIRDLRVSPMPYNPFDFRAALQFWGIGGGVMAFDYGAATIRFGVGLEEGEAKSVIAQVKSRGFRL